MNKSQKNANEINAYTNYSVDTMFFRMHAKRGFKIGELVVASMVK